MESYYILFSVWHISLSITILIFTHVVMGITSLFLSIAGSSILFYFMDIPCSLSDGHFGLFQLLTITNKAAMNSQVLIFV